MSQPSQPDRRFTLGAFAIIFDDQGRVLLCHRRDRDQWNLPGGGVELGELPTEAAVREAKEETGLDITTTRLLGVYAKADDPSDLVFTFLGKVAGGRIAVTDEADGCAYFAIADIPPNTAPKHVERIHDAVSGAAQPIFRRQGQA